MNNTILLDNVLKPSDFPSGDYSGGTLSTRARAWASVAIKTEEKKSNVYRVSIQSVEKFSYDSFIRVTFQKNYKLVNDYILMIDEDTEDFFTDLSIDGEIDEILLDYRNLTIHGFTISPNTGSYTSPKIERDVITTVIKENVITADVMMANNAWISNLSVDSLETNFQDISPIYPGNKGKTGDFLRNYIRVSEQKSDYIQELRSYNEVEPYVLKDQNGKNVQIYWSAIGTHEDAYKFFTTTHPKTIYPDLTDSEVDDYVVKIFKLKGQKLTKLAIEFDEKGEPSITFGKDSDPSFGPYSIKKTAEAAIREWYKFREVITPGKSISTSIADTFGNLSELLIDVSIIELKNSGSSLTIGPNGVQVSSNNPINQDVKRVRNIAIGSELPLSGEFADGDMFFII